ncbi:MAG: cytochrome c [Proteobacteria bacterium]|nr:cytochrome c [Pseudomonadota bacterium]
MIRNLSLVMVGLSLAAAPFAASAAGDAAKGKTLFETNCASCHGTSGKGDGPVGVALPEPKPRNFTVGEFKFDTDKDGKTGTDADLMNVVKNGAAAYGGNALMAGWPQLPETDITDIIVYVRTFKQ